MTVKAEVDIRQGGVPMTPQYKFHRERLLKFREARVAEAAWCWNSQYPGHAAQRCLDLGISEEEIREGFELGERMSREYWVNCSTHGDPAYGSWGVFGDAPAEPIRNLVLIWLQGPCCVECGGLPYQGSICCHAEEAAALQVSAAIFMPSAYELACAIIGAETR